VIRSVVIILAAAWFVAPRIIAATIRARSRDVFILSVITVVLETAYLNPRLVRAGKMAASLSFMEMALSETVLKNAGIAQAQIAVFAISDPVATRVGVAAARALSAGVSCPRNPCNPWQVPCPVGQSRAGNVLSSSARSSTGPTGV
jgi:hypothetical protein